MSFEFDPHRTQDQLDTLLKETAPKGLVPAWSYSSLKNYESCPHRIFLSKVEKLPEEAGPAAERGTQIHTLAEEYVQGHLEKMPTELKKFQDEFTKLKAAFLDGQVILEQDWGFTNAWDATGWAAPDTWLRMKLDAFHHHDQYSATVIDYKTGKKFGNEIAHLQQAQLYAIGAFERFSDLEYIKCEFWYLDKGETLEKEYTRSSAEQFKRSWDKRALQLTSDTEFIPNPSKNNCRWCPHQKSESCKWAIT
jgi:CRISPR/Cas system-associated exonuclease Cas4 (RecB family)